MIESDDKPRSLPCSNEEAKCGMPVMVQLHLVDAALEKNPLPREDFYRQYSITPERRTPEGDRTPPPPTYSPGTILEKRKAWAASVAQGLKQFHIGRAMLRKEEAEQQGVLREDPDYWSSRADRWQDEMWKLMKEMGRRKKLELKGEAEEGYALTMLPSPLQSLSPPPSNVSLPAIAQHLKTTTALSDKLPENSTRPSRPLAGLSQRSLQPTPKHHPGYLPTLTKSQKRTYTEVDNQEEESMDQTSRTKRQRRELATAQQKLEQVPATKSTQGLGKNNSKVFRTIAKEGPKGRNVPKASLAQRTLPWKLRSRVVKSYCETSTNSTKIRGHQAKKKIRPKRPGLNMN
ncbi:MAG: hypothetical protein Q9175_006273 [Cornicularia normoerica]